MKSPTQLRQTLIKQWNTSSHRIALVLEGEFPIILNIGKPTATEVKTAPDSVREHRQAWERVRVGEVVTAEVAYRATASAITLPVQWVITDLHDWEQAIAPAPESEEIQTLRTLMAQPDLSPDWLSLLVTRKHLWRGLTLAELELVCNVTTSLTPGCADGLPLRALTLPGADTKFLDRHRRLILALLDAHYDDQPSAVGLEAFLGAASTGAHWLLVHDLDGGLLPAPSIRMKSSDLARPQPPVANLRALLIIENEQCLHHLPPLPGALAILGSGLDLDWLAAPWLTSLPLAYWGDLDTWGLHMLRLARQHQPHLTPLLMTEEIYTTHQSHAVAEPTPAPQPETPDTLDTFLRQQSHPRLEQEFLPIPLAQQSIHGWYERQC